MRAKTVYKKSYVFDFDETLVKTSAHIHIYRNGAFFKSITPKQYNFYIKQRGDKLDFSEFVDGDLILNAQKYNAWPILKKVSDAIKEEKSTSEIFILTARDRTMKAYIYEFLKRNGIIVNIKNIITIGDNVGNISIAHEKYKILSRMVKKYDEIIFYDDDPNNIKIAASIKGVKTKLIENGYAK
jgi:FMN phosphatase YigB (HAD superfamily)